MKKVALQVVKSVPNLCHLFLFFSGNNIYGGTAFKEDQRGISASDSKLLLS